MRFVFVQFVLNVSEVLPMLLGVIFGDCCVLLSAEKARCRSEQEFFFSELLSINLFNGCHLCGKRSLVFTFLVSLAVIQQESIDNLRGSYSFQ